MCYSQNMKATLYRHNKSGFAPPIFPTKINFNDLTFVLKGNLSYLIDGEKISLKAGDAILIKQGSLRTREENNKVEYISFNYVGSEGADLPLHITDCISYEIKLLFGVCDEILKTYALYEDKIVEVISLIIKFLSEKKKTMNENPLVSAIKKHIFENLQANITLSSIASHVGYSPNYCDTVFKKNEGTSIINYLIAQRITEAKRLIIEGVTSLKDVAINVGYNDYNYFSRIFKKNVGCSPKDFALKGSE